MNKTDSSTPELPNASDARATVERARTVTDDDLYRQAVTEISAAIRALRFSISLRAGITAGVVRRLQEKGYKVEACQGPADSEANWTISW